MRILVTGHRGFIGRNVYEHFSTDHDVVGIDIKDGIDLYDCVLPDVDVVIHLAANAGVRQSIADPIPYWRNNVEVSKRLFEHYKQTAYIAYASSSSAKQWYNNPYATTKAVVEVLAPNNSCGMRFHTVYGVDSRPDMMYDKLINGRAKYATNHSRDFTHVSDVVSAIECVIQHRLTGVIDVGTGAPVSVLDLVEAAGQRLPIQSVTGEAVHTEANPTALLSCGWRPTKNVLEQIRYDIVRKT